jgi:hypothetical protein
VIPGVTELSRNRVGIRLEVQQAWKTPHPADASVPSSARFLEVSRRIGRRHPTFQLVRAAGGVRRIADAINALPAVQPEETYWRPCENDLPRVRGEHQPRSLEVRMKFRVHKAGPLLLRR